MEWTQQQCVLEDPIDRLLCVADRPGGAGLDFEGTEGLQEAIATIDAIAWNATVFCF